MLAHLLAYIAKLGMGGVCVPGCCFVDHVPSLHRAWWWGRLASLLINTLDKMLFTSPYACILLHAKYFDSLQNIANICCSVKVPCVPSEYMMIVFPQALAWQQAVAWA